MPLYRETDIDIEVEVEERKLKPCLKNFSGVNISGQVAGSRLDNSGCGEKVKTKSRSNRTIGTQTSRVACKLM